MCELYISHQGWKLRCLNFICGSSHVHLYFYSLCSRLYLSPSLSHRLEAMACFCVQFNEMCCFLYSGQERREKHGRRRRSSREKTEMSSCQDLNGLVTVFVLHCDHCESLYASSTPRHAVVCLVSTPHTAEPLPL